MGKKGTWKFIVVGIGIICLAPIFIGSTKPGMQTTASFQSVKGWEEKQNRKLGGVRPRLNQSELIKMSARLQAFAQREARVGKAANASRSSLRQALEHRRGKPIDLTTRMRKARQPQTIQRDIWWHERNGTPIFITGSELRPKGLLSPQGLLSRKTPQLASTVSAEERALAFIEANRDLFQLENPRSELEVAESFRDQFGKQHVKLAQWYEGVPVWGHDLVVHLEANGELYGVNARYSPTPREISLNDAKISAGQAIQITRQNLSSRTTIEDFNAWTRQLLSYQGPKATQYIRVDQETQKPYLVWHVQIRPNLRDNWHYFVDAISGRILEHYNATNFDGPATANATDLNNVTQTIHVYQVGNTYYMIDASRPIWQNTQPDILNDPKGALWTLNADGKDLSNQTQVFHVISTDNTWIDPASVSAHSNMGLVFEYFFNTHGRRAIDGNGSTVISIIHVTEDGQPMDNAYWNSAVMAYGDGNVAFKPLAGALDVAGHEMTHGVIERTVNLEYKFQSGALNESYADVFGVMVDRADWKLGEDVVDPAFFPSGTMRDMENPHNGGTSINDAGWQPGHMSEFMNLTLDQDNGGVHINSGIPNRAASMIGVAIGKDKTEKIYYRVLEARYLNSQSQFIDQRLAVIRAATELYGDNSAEVNAVKAAFDGVGITGDTGTNPPGDIPPVQGEQWIAVVNAEVINNIPDNSLFLVKPVISNSATDIVQLTSSQVFTNSSKPISVSDDGSFILFIDSDNFIRGIQSDGTNEVVFTEAEDIWSSIALSPDATKLAATTIAEDSTIYIFDLVDPDASKAIHLYSPTTQQGVKSDVTVFADALDWDLGGEFVLYDAFNRIPQAGGGAITYWDVNILDVANEIILPIFPPQPEGFSIGNPSFAETNDNFFVFDYADFNQGTDVIMAVDLFTGDVGMIESNGTDNGSPNIGHPKYSPDDSRIVFQRIVANRVNLRQIPITATKILPAGQSQDYVIDGQLPTWFAIGTRTGVEEKPQTVPLEYALHQNYPNPFNPETTIRYRMPVNGQVAIVIFDIEGRRVATLESGAKTAGEHAVRWNGLDGAGNRVTSGVYFYRLEAISPTGAVTTLTKKMTLVK